MTITDYFLDFIGYVQIKLAFVATVDGRLRYSCSLPWGSSDVSSLVHLDSLLKEVYGDFRPVSDISSVRQFTSWPYRACSHSGTSTGSTCFLSVSMETTSPEVVVDSLTSLPLTWTTGD